MPATTRVRLTSGEPLLRSGYALVISTAASSMLGVAYWILAARTFPSETLGQESAAIAAMMMLSNFAQMNMFYALTRFVPTAGPGAARLIAWSYAANAAVAALFAAVFVVAAPRLSGNFSYLQGPVRSIAFVGAVVLWGIFCLQDGVLTALRRATWVPVENALFGLFKLGLLVALAVTVNHGGIFASWNVPVLLVVIPVNALVFRRLLPTRPTHEQTGAPVSFGTVRRFVAVDYVSSLFVQCYTTALPLLIVATLGAEANAEFYVAYVIIAAVDLVAINLSTSLLAEGSRDEHRMAEYTRQILLRCAVLLVPGVAVVELGAPMLFHVFGHDYAAESTTLLRVMLIGSLPRMLNIVYVATMRVERRVGRIVAIQSAIAVMVVGLTLLLIHPLGVTAVAVAWVCAHTAVAVVLLPWLFRVLREGGRR